MKRRFSSRLAELRKERSIQQKQLARLLGLRSAEHISRFERGTQLPSLKTAVKLAIVFKIPIRLILDEYFEACRKEIVMKESYLLRLNRSLPIDQTSGYCWVEENLKSIHAGPTDLDDAYTHSSKLIRLRSEKLGAD